MSNQDAFWSAFEDEVEKVGGVGMLFGIGKMLGKLKGLIAPGVAKAKQFVAPGVSKAKQFVAPGIAKAKQMAAPALSKLRQSGPGRYLGRSPRLKKFLGFAGGQAAVGAATEGAMIPLQGRQRIVEIVPEQASHLRRGFY